MLQQQVKTSYSKPAIQKAASGHGNVLAAAHGEHLAALGTGAVFIAYVYPDGDSVGVLALGDKLVEGVRGKPCAAELLELHVIPIQGNQVEGKPDAMRRGGGTADGGVESETAVARRDADGRRAEGMIAAPLGPPLAQGIEALLDGGFDVAAVFGRGRVVESALAGGLRCDGFRIGKVLHGKLCLKVKNRYAA